VFGSSFPNNNPAFAPCKSNRIGKGLQHDAASSPTKSEHHPLWMKEKKASRRSATLITI
jgi:hypothetical protein